MRFKKIKTTSDDKIHLAYEQMNKSGGWDEYTITSSDRALPEFYDALKDLARFVCEMCEFPKKDIDRITVRGVSFSYAGENDNMGATIIAQKELHKSNTPLNINTPHKIQDFYSEGGGDENQLLPVGCVSALIVLCDEAERYASGEREQMDLFPKKEEVEEKAEEVTA